MPTAHRIDDSRGTIWKGNPELFADQAGVDRAGAAGHDHREFRADRSRVLIVTSRTPCAMLVQTTRYMPAAAVSTSIFQRCRDIFRR